MFYGWRAKKVILCGACYLRDQRVGMVAKLSCASRVASPGMECAVLLAIIVTKVLETSESLRITRLGIGMGCHRTLMIRSSAF